MTTATTEDNQLPGVVGTGRAIFRNFLDSNYHSEELKGLGVADAADAVVDRRAGAVATNRPCDLLSGCGRGTLHWFSRRGRRTCGRIRRAPATGWSAIVHDSDVPARRATRR